MPDLYFTVFSSKKLYDRPIFVRCVFHSHAVEIRLRAVITIDLEKGRIFVRPLLLKRLTMQRCHRQVIIGQSHAFELPKIVSNSKSNRSCNRRFTIDKNGSPLLRFRKQRVTFNTAQLQKNLWISPIALPISVQQNICRYFHLSDDSWPITHMIVFCR